MSLQINVCPKLWDDIKFLRKKTHRIELENTFPIEDQMPDSQIIDSIPQLKAMTTYITQTNGTNDDTSEKLDRQPYLSDGWTIFKQRYAFNNQGASKGLRIIYCRNGENYLIVYINLKPYCSNERALEKEVIQRISDYLCLNNS